MLLEDLRKAIEDMEEIQGLEQDSQDSQMQKKIDNLYGEEVNNNNKFVYSIDNTIKFVGFVPSLSLKEQVLQLLKDSQNCMETGAVSMGCLKALQSGAKKVREDFGAEWNVFYKNISDKRLHMIMAIKEITPDKNKAGYVINKIRSGSVINYENDNKIRQLAEGLSEAGDILKQMGLEKEDEIMLFLDKVSEGQATLLDLNDPIIKKWIGENNLGSKFLIKFSV